ncbi:hypothetical protein FO519_004790 [Halicephalobus sp. NKZ332]|nr:hypothetical protein FO519_004790 [Halicephalobus sp. NKZ332]
MPYRKYREVKQFGRFNTRIFKKKLSKVNSTPMPSFEIPEAVKAYGAVVKDPSDQSFWRQFEKPIQIPELLHPAFKKPSIEDHPLYNEKECRLFESFEPFSDGVDQVCHLIKALKFEKLPTEVTEVEYSILKNTAEEDVRDCIMQGERYDPTLERLERRHDKVLFWVVHPIVHGTPVGIRNNIILESIYRKVVLAAVKEGKLADLRADRDQYLSAILNNTGFSDKPFVVRSQPHLTIQCEKPLSPWANSEDVENSKKENCPDVSPISPFIDLGKSNLYNRSPLICRSIVPDLHLDTLLISRQQNQKYPWTTEQNAANALMICFGAALAQATRNLNFEEISRLRDLKKPVLTKAIQLVDGKLDFVAVQLNTLDLSSRDGIKNFVWCEKGVPLYKPKPYWENMDKVEGLNMGAFHKFMSLQRVQSVLLRRHARLLKRMLDCAPGAYSSLETNRMTLLFFILSGLDLINELDNVVDLSMKKRLIEMIYKMQLTKSSGCSPERCGFRGSLSASSPEGSEKICELDSAHVAQTYSALCCLLILGDDLSRVDREGILEATGKCQQKDGSFSGFGEATEADMRFVYCATAVCYILDGFSFIDEEKLVDFIRKSRAYEGGFGQGPNLEAHGGSTYCAVASLFLLNRIYDYTVLKKSELRKLITWAVKMQDEGFHGRTNKPDDTCYAFWIGASLDILNSGYLVNTETLRGFLLECQDTSIGGFCKYTDAESSDVLHTYFGIAALSIFNEPLLKPIFPALNISMRAFEHLQNLKSKK